MLYSEEKAFVFVKPQEYTAHFEYKHNFCLFLTILQRAHFFKPSVTD